MKHFTVYDNVGNILRSGTVTDDVDVQIQAGINEFVIDQESDPENDLVDVTNNTVVKGAKPPPPIDMDYRKARSEIYPSAENQLDMLWHAMNDGTMPKVEPFYSRIKLVKESYPKDNSVAPGSVSIYGVD
jgi:hypothetical protein